jgi:hypothetical protein
LKEYREKISITKQNLQKFSKKNLSKDGFVHYRIVQGNIPIIYITMTLQDIKILFVKFQKDLKLLPELLATIFQKSIWKDLNLCNEIIRFFSICLLTNQKHNAPQLEWFFQNLANCVEFFGKDSVYHMVWNMLKTCLFVLETPTGTNHSETIFNIFFKLFQKLENAETHLDGFAGMLLEFFLKTPKQIKIKTYMRNVLKNYKNYDVAFVSQVVMFVYSSGLGSEMKELLEKVVKNNHVNMYVYIGRYSKMNQLLLFVDADMRMLL